MRKTFALCALALIVVAGNAFALGEARVQGKITDAGSHKPIENAVITLDAVTGHSFHAQYKTDKEGVYRFIVLDGTLFYKVTYTAPDYSPLEQQRVKFSLGDINTRDVMLVPAGSAAAGTKDAPAAKVDPGVLAYNEGAALANAGKVPEAIAKLEEAVALKPDLIAGYEALAKLYIRPKSAAYDVSVTSDSHEPVNQHVIISEVSPWINYDKAIDRANKALEIDTDNQEMFDVLARAYTAKGDKTKASEYRKKLPADATSMFNDAAKLINSGKDAEAEPLLKGAIAANEKFAQAYYELGMIYVRTQKNAEAKVNLLKYLELEPNGKDAATAKEMLNYVK